MASTSSSLSPSSASSSHPFSPLASNEQDSVSHPLSDDFTISIDDNVESKEFEGVANSGSLEEPLMAKSKVADVRKVAASTEERLCRICYGGEDDGPLISPCECSGAMGSIHTSCLHKW